MIQRLMMTALAAGFLAGIAMAALQQFTTVPMILAAETFETAAPSAAQPHSHDRAGHGHGTADSGQEAGGHHHDAEAWAPADGAERLFYTVTADVVAGVGFALLLVGCFALAGRDVDGKSGLLWGLAGFATFTLAPGMGLAPELPTMAAGELVARQAWWFAAAGCMAAGLWLMVYRTETVAKAAAVLVVALPHLIGAPHAAGHSNSVPPELAAHFAATSIAVSAAFWCLLGWLSGTFYRHFARKEQAADAIASAA